MKILILALGNDLLGDDGAAFITADYLAEKLKTNKNVEIIKTLRSGAALLEYFTNDHDLIYLIDTIIGREKGKIRHIELNISGIPSSPLHYMGLSEVIAILKAVGLSPPKIKIYAIEITEIKYGYEVSDEVKEAAKKLADIIFNEIKKFV